MRKKQHCNQWINRRYANTEPAVSSYDAILPSIQTLISHSTAPLSYDTNAFWKQQSHKHPPRFPTKPLRHRIAIGR